MYFGIFQRKQLLDYNVSIQGFMLTLENYADHIKQRLAELYHTRKGHANSGFCKSNDRWL